MTDDRQPLQDSPFWRRYEGQFHGILTWPQFDAFWPRLVPGAGDWFVFDPGARPPQSPLARDAFMTFLDEARSMLERRRNLSYCGAVYADDLHAPTFVKLFDPMNMGSACAMPGARIMPRWTLSLLRPDPLPDEEPVPERQRFRGWMRRG